MRYCEAKQCINPAKFVITTAAENGKHKARIYVCSFCKDKTYPLFQNIAESFNELMPEIGYTVGLEEF